MSEQEHVLAQVIAACEGIVMAEVRVRAPELPPLAVTVDVLGKPGRLGWYRVAPVGVTGWRGGTSRVWAVGLTLQGCRRSAAEVMETLVHESVHALAAARGIADTSRQGRWHNERFRSVAVGLDYEPGYSPRVGYGVPGELGPTWGATLARFTLAWAALRWPPEQDVKPPPPKVRRVLVGRCGCEGQEWPVKLPEGKTGLLCMACEQQVEVGV